ncbi:putative BldB protein [Streptomyces lividans 1326]|nr:putative BldB protein [Streptomyces lividans 1326]
MTAQFVGTAGRTGPAMAEAEDKELRARKDRERDELYALDISGVEWHSAPGTEAHEERVEIAYLPDGAVAMRSSLDHNTVLRYTEAEWRAFVLGARDGEFDLESAAERSGGDVE